MKVKFERNKAFLKVANNSTQVIDLYPKSNNSLRHLIIWLLKNPTRSLTTKTAHYSFDSLQNIFEGYSNFKNKLQEEVKRSISIVRTK